MRPGISRGAAILAFMAVAAPSARAALPAAWFLDPRGTSAVDEPPRLVAGGSHRQPPTSRRGVIWSLTDGCDRALARLRATPELRLELLNGDRVTVDTRMPASNRAAGTYWGLAGLVAAASGALGWRIVRWLRRRRATDRQALERLIDEAIARRSASPAADAESRREPAQDTSEAALRAIEEALERASRQLEASAREQEQRLASAAKHLAAELQGHPESCRQQPAAQPGHRPDAAAPPGAAEKLRCELAELASDERQPLLAAVAALGRLGELIEDLWTILPTVAGSDLESIAAGLPEPAGREWRHAHQKLTSFARVDAPALRRLFPTELDCEPGGQLSQPLSSAATAFLEDAGLLDDEPSLPQRLRAYLSPFDRIGRLAEVTLALQYLLEAYPIEQLSPDQRSHLRRLLAEASRELTEDRDWHSLMRRIAAGIHLYYRPVVYYKSRIDQKDFAFVRQQVSPISLSERVGFAATTKPTVVVRLERPFFFQMGTNVYHSGHAHVARG